MDKYKILKNLGDGTYGNVAQAVNQSTQELVAIKKMKKKFYSWEECMSLREIKALRKLSHPHIVKLKEVIRVNNDLYLVFEYMQGNVYELIKDAKGPGLGEERIKSVLYQTLQGLEYMHSHGVFHRDLKPENLLFYNGLVKVADFGLSKDIQSTPPYTDYVSTRWYRAPEILLHSTTYNAEVDIFAMGCIAAELFTGQPLFPGRNEHDQLYRLCAVLGRPPEQWHEGYSLAINTKFVFPKFQQVDITRVIPKANPKAIDLIMKMLMWDPKYRPSAKECLNHPYFSDLNKQAEQINKKVDQNTVPNYEGPNHDSQPLFRRNNSMIQNAVHQQLFGERRDQFGFKNDLYHQKYGSNYSDFKQQSHPFQQQSQTLYPKYSNPNSLPLQAKAGFRNESQPALPKNPNYFQEASQLNHGNKKNNIFGRNFEQMLKKSENFEPIPTIDQRFQKEPQQNYKNLSLPNFNQIGLEKNQRIANLFQNTPVSNPRNNF